MTSSSFVALLMSWMPRPDQIRMGAPWESFSFDRKLSCALTDFQDVDHNSTKVDGSQVQWSCAVWERKCSQGRSWQYVLKSEKRVDVFAVTKAKSDWLDLPLQKVTSCRYLLLLGIKLLLQKFDANLAISNPRYRDSGVLLYNQLMRIRRTVSACALRLDSQLRALSRAMECRFELHPFAQTNG